MWLVEIFSIPWLKNLAIPVLGTLLGIGIKVLSRNDNITDYRKENDYAVGFEMAITATIIFLLNTFSLSRKALLAVSPDVTSDAEKLLQIQNQIELANQSSRSLFIFLSLCATLVAISYVVRKFGFNKAVFPKEELNLNVGIIVPFVFGLLSLVAAGFIAE